MVSSTNGGHFAHLPVSPSIARHVVYFIALLALLHQFLAIPLWSPLFMYPFVPAADFGSILRWQAAKYRNAKLQLFVNTRITS
ncbi:hypothetical protein ANTRET_LOCUS7748 [Anthophora retusa]